MYELNLSPGFRAEESSFSEFVAMAEAVPVPRRTVELQLQAILGHDTSSRLPGETLADVGHMFSWEQPELSAELIRAHALAA